MKGKMKVRANFPRAVREISNVWIPLPDGCRLSARIWLPHDANEDPVPAILEYLPYRKNDATALRDAAHHPYFAGHGYACVRVDMRGSGDSDGILLDEYLPQEQEDGCDILAWLEQQEWCTGAVGLYGKSWGGYNGLQIAAWAPPQLKAVVSAYSTDDRYLDDIHYFGGCQYAYAHLSWASTMLAYNGRPPDPTVVGEERWREMWLDRLERTPPYIEEWIRHQRRDDFWQQGSVRVDYDAIKCPIYMIGGWADPLRNTPLRFAANFNGPVKVLIGPWAHVFPHEGAPGPAIGFLQECLRWYDQHLKKVETGIMEEPTIRVWMQDAVRPQTGYDHRPGRWVAEPGWPSPRIEGRRLFLAPDRLVDAVGEEGELEHAGQLAHGMESPQWLTWGSDSDFAPDQRGEDGRSLCFISEPLSETVEILGYPEVTVTAVPDREVAQLAVRLCDVWPDDSSTLVSFGVLNLTHRESDEEPEPLVPGEPTPVSVRMNAVAYAFPVGHRIRLALAPSYWPWTWPAPEALTLRVRIGSDTESALVLPVRPPGPEDERLRQLEEPELPPPLSVAHKEPPGSRRYVSRDLSTGQLHSWTESTFGGVRFEGKGEYAEVGRDGFTIVEGNPLSAEARSRRVARVGRGEWQARIETDSTMSADREHYHLTNILHAYEGERRVFAKTWSTSIPRDLA